MDQISALRCFAAVFETGGFARAAASRGVSQSLVSKAITRLEQQLGSALFHRSTRSVVPTEEGRALYLRCALLLGELDEALSESAKQTRSLKGTLRIAAPATFGRIFLSPTLALFRQRFPDLQLDVVSSDGRTDLLAGGVDIALRVGGEDGPNEIVKPLARTRIRLVGTRDYFDRYGVPTHPRDLLQHRCLVYTQGRNSCDWPFMEATNRFHVTVPAAIRADNLDVIRTAVIHGAGIGAMTEVSMTEELRSPHALTILEGFVPWTLDIKAVWTKRRCVPNKLRAFVDFLFERLEHTPGAEMIRS